MKFSTEVQVRFADMDAYGHLNHATFFTYLETARTIAFRGIFLDLMSKGQLLLVVNAECSYKAPIGPTDRAIVTMQLEKSKRSSFTLGYRVHDGEERTFAEAKTVMICFDENRGKPVAVPPELKEVLSQV
ncbi:MAG TPA: thioesterase family protein [Geopsychrobacteraceae bacterium]|nr:thioesterase family protein [Geopsychrobacteraceae bacterium]